MNKAETKEVLGMLLGAFPRNGLDDDGIRIWSEALTEFDLKEAKKTASQFVQNDEFMPSIAKFRATHRNLLRVSKNVNSDKCNRTDCWSGWVDANYMETRVDPDTEEVTQYEHKAVRPCAGCRKELFNRWLEGTLHKPTPV
ncbi:MAG: hypothetical protein CML60_09950 [Rhodobacteraceae bacterium]|nr:hypothetical protein [Paracoccaceae bacterium]